jgi:hypothetical protein
MKPFPSSPRGFLAVGGLTERTGGVSERAGVRRVYFWGPVLAYLPIFAAGIPYVPLRAGLCAVSLWGLLQVLWVTVLASETGPGASIRSWALPSHKHALYFPAAGNLLDLP